MLKLIACSAIWVVALGVNGSAHASDATEYESFAVRNNTDTAIRYEVRWGNKGWKTFTLSPSTTRCHSNRDHDDERLCLAPMVRYETGGNEYKPIAITHLMTTERIDQSCSVEPYLFRVNGSGRLHLQIVRTSDRTRANRGREVVLNW